MMIISSEERGEIMHFRIRGNSVQVVKSMTDPATGKASPKPIGSVNLSTGEPNIKLVEALSENEKVELEKWIARHKEMVEKRRNLEYLVLPDRLREVAEWLRTADRDNVLPGLDELSTAMQELRGAINKLRS